MMPRRVRLAVLIAFLGHGLFILTARYRLSYDAYTHMLFANHYAEDWFSLWETRWYTGFTVVSYPPLTHQLIALFVPFLGVDKAFALLLWIVTSLYPLGIYAFSRVFVGRTTSSGTALASSVLLPIYVAAHIFGQLPFLAGTIVALLVAASFNRYLYEGGRHNFALSVALITTSMALHHATLMVHPFLMFAVTIHHLALHKKRTMRLWLVSVWKLLGFGLVSVLTSILVIFPFWQWGTVQTMQTPIDHLSRHNFLSDPFALAIFFFPLYGPFLVILPFLFQRWQPRFWGLLISFALLFLLGLGGTTPLPRLLFGDAWQWLTYDRFSFWACLALTPFFGMFWIRLRRRWKNQIVTKPAPLMLRRNFLSALVFSGFALTVLGAWLTPLVFPVQPKPIAMQPIIDFLSEGDHSEWRYLTFGFGDQFAYLNLLTTATTIDGSYHTARTLPELRESGIGQVDTAYWAANGIAAIRPIVQKSGQHSVRWGFVNPETLETTQVNGRKVQSSPFTPLLNGLGWKKISTLDNGILVYENPAVSGPLNHPTPAFSPMAAFAWGVFPMLAFAMTIALGALRLYPVQAEWVLRKVYALVLSLIPLALCFWVYRTIGEFSHARVYFTYDQALFFLSDALAVVAVLLWLAVRISRGSHPKVQRPIRRFLPFAFLLFTTLSAFWSRDWRTTLYISLHFWLVLLLILSLRDWHESWSLVMYGLCAALSIQLIAGVAGFGLQSTSFLSAWNPTWPGAIQSSLPGASVVQLANGERILRAYGTLPHPNILGGLVFVTLLGPTVLYFARQKPNYPALLLLSLGLILLVLTFSRSAWLGYIVFVIILVLKSKPFKLHRTLLFIATILITVALTLYTVRDLVLTRTSNQYAATEQISTVGRSWLAAQALKTIRAHPLIGVGGGSFLLELAAAAPAGAPIEPVHDVILLVTAELGIVGLALLLSILGLVIVRMVRSRSPKSIFAGAMLAGLGTISLFDHYLWTLAPGRILLGLALGLWAGQVAHES